jgi:carbamoyl-phosphate synthase large subunit
MTGAGAPGAPGIIHCLKQDPAVHLTVADADENATGRYLVKDFIHLPKADDPNFTDFLLDTCTKKNIHVVLPLVTKELFPLSQDKNRFEERKIKVLVSSPEAIERANNKEVCYRFLQEKGIAVPAYFPVTNVEEFIHAAFGLGHPAKSFVFKPSVSNGSRGVRIVIDSLDEAAQLFEQKPYQLQISYPHALSILSSKPFPPLLVSEYLPGEEYSVDCLAEHGKAKLVVPRSRIKMVNGISVQGCFVKDTEIINYCSKIIEAIGLHGNIGIQVKYNSNNQPRLLEINPRVQGTIVAGLGAGINLPLLAAKQELGIPLTSDELQPRWGTRFSRYWKEVYY